MKNILILENAEAFSKLSSHIIAKQHLIAYGDGPTHFRIVKDRLNGNYWTKIPANTLHWYIEKN
jgi:hypothetical protein